MNHFGKLHRISLILNIMFLILMPKIYSFDNIYLSIIWTLLGIANAVYLLIKQRQENTIKRKWIKKNSLIMMCTPEVGLKSIFMGCFLWLNMINLILKLKFFKNIKMVKKQSKKTSKACLLKNYRRQAFKILH
mgnify:FL=1